MDLAYAWGYRQRKQAEYVEDFRGAVLAFLDFAPEYAELAEQLADAVSQHATPVGSGTVARTQRIPIDRRAESTVIVWLRHRTTAYETMRIPRTKGRRREIRRMLAELSRRLLEKYRRGFEAAPTCPLQQALSRANPSSAWPGAGDYRIFRSAYRRLLQAAQKVASTTFPQVDEQVGSSPNAERWNWLLWQAHNN